MRITWLFVVVCCLRSLPAQAAAPDRIDRLVGAARLWSEVKVYHPWIWTRTIDWDAALVAAIPAVEAADTVDEYRAVLDHMLATLGDPVTAIDRAPDAPAPAPTEWLTWKGDVAIVDLRGPFGMTDNAAAMATLATIQEAAKKAKVVVVDLRGFVYPPEYLEWYLEQLGPVTGGVTTTALEERIVHDGFRGQGKDAYGKTFYSTELAIDAAAPAPSSDADAAPLVFVTDATAVLAPLAMSLVASGRAEIVSQGAMPERGLVTTRPVALPYGLTATVRGGEKVMPDGRRAAADVVTAGDPMAKALEVAGKLAAGGHVPRRRAGAIAVPIVHQDPDADYADQPYPSRELRLLGAIRLWHVIEYYSPHRYLIADWDAVLRQGLADTDAAGDAHAYLLALDKMAAATNDGHTVVFADGDVATTVIEPRLIEGKLVIASVANADDAAKAGVAIGDEIVTIGGVAAADALAAKRPYVSASTPAARDQRTAAKLFYGKPGDTIAVEVRGADGKLRAATLPFADAYTALAPAPHYRVLAGNVGYVDLTRLTVDEIAAAFDAIAKTRATIFDLRGYPNATGWEVTARLNTRHATDIAEFLEPVRRADRQGDGRYRFFQPMAPLPDGAALYTGKVVVLIDDRAVSQSEHTCLMFQQATDVTFIGSTTHGTNGDVTEAVLPGGLTMWFTGQEVRHVDGARLEQVGIVPDVEVRPTIKGLRAGKDEVLDRALLFLKKK